MVTTVIMAVQYAFLFGIDFLFNSDSELMNKMIGGNTMTYDIALLGWIVIFLGGTFGIYFALWGICGLFRKKCHPGPMLVGVLKILFWIAVLISAMLFRLYLSASSEVVTLNDSSYYDAAVLIVSQNADFTMMGVHGASFAYLCILSLAIRLLGTRTIAVVIVQIIIQMLTILFVGAFMKRVFGFGSSVVTALILAFMPLYTDKLFSATPGCLLALMFAFGIYLVSVIRFMRNTAWRRIVALVFGICIGYGIYLDALMAGVLIVWLFAFIHELGDKERKKSASAYLLMLLGVILGAAVSLAIDGAFTVDGFVIAALSWWKVTYTSELPEFSLIDSLLDARCVPICMGLTGMALFSVYDFFRREKTDYELIWVMSMILALTPVTRIGYLHDSTLSMVIYMVYAGVGFSAIFRAVKNDAKASEAQPVAVEAAADTAGDEEGKSADTVEAGNEDGTGATEGSDVSDRPEKADEALEYSEENIDEDYSEDDYEDYDEEDEEDEPEEEIDYTKIKTVNDLPFWNSDDDRRGPEDDDICDDPLDKEVAEVMRDKAAGAKESADTSSKPEDKETSNDDSDSAEGRDLVIHMQKGYSVVLEGVEDFIGEETSEETEPEEVAEPEETESEETAESEESKAEEVAEPIKDEAVSAPVQVDDLPGMIPNPLPLPPKKAHSQIDYNKSFDDDDLDFDIDISDDDDFDV